VPAHPSSPPDPRFAPFIAAFRNDGQVTYGGKGFGSSGLKVDGRIFALISSRGLFVAKLPRQRVDELVRAGRVSASIPGTGGR
jgi:hypothetical protein